MYIKRLVKEMWVRLGVTAFVPPVLLWLLLNIWNFHDLLYPNRSTKYFMDERMLLLLPIGIGILSVVSCLPYLAQNGREVLYIQRSQLNRQLTINDVYYVVVVTIEYVLVYHKSIKAGSLAYFRYVLLSLAVSQICVLLLYAVKHVTMTLVLLTAGYLVLCLLHGGGTKIVDLFSWNYEDETYLIQMLILFLITLGGNYGRRKLIEQYCSY